MRDLFKNVNGFSQDYVDAVLVSTCDNAQYTASILSEMLGIKPKIAHRIENMCNSGSNALISAYSYIASGLCDIVMVVGVEKADSPSVKLEWDLTRGQFTHPAHWAAMFSKAHMNEYGTTEEQMAMVSVKNHKNRENIGHRIHKWATDLFPICRSITGDGVRQTLNYIKELLPLINHIS